MLYNIVEHAKAVKIDPENYLKTCLMLMEQGVIFSGQPNGDLKKSWIIKKDINDQIFYNFGCYSVII